MLVFTAETAGNRSDRETMPLHKYQLFLSLRYLYARKMNIICVLAVALSVMVLIIVLGVMWGFDRQFRAQIRGVLSDILVEGRVGYNVQDYALLQGDIQTVKGVRATAPYIEQPWTTVRHNNLAYQATVRGVDMAQELRVSQLGSYLAKTGKSADFNLDGKALQHPGAIAGAELYKELALLPGEPIVLVSPWSSVNDVPFVCTTVGKFDTGMYQYDLTLLYIPLEAAQDAFGLEGEVTGISVMLEDGLGQDYARADQVKQEIQDLLGSSYRVETWRDRQRTFLAAIALERRVTSVIVGFSFLLAATTILATMTMSVRERTRDIGILRSLGGNAGGVMSIFLLDALLIAVIGSALGLTAGLLFSANINEISDLVYRLTEFRVFPPELYYFVRIPTYLSVTSAAVIVAMAIATSLAGAIIPALSAARLDPIRALRYE